MAIPDGFDPAPTLPTGGLDRMIEIWEAARDQNDGGYGGGVLHKVRHWGSPSGKKWTSCSPFTATTIGMMFDPDGGSDPDKTYSPKCDGGKQVLPVDFYSLHNGFYFDVDTSGTAKQVEASKKVSQARKDQFKRNKWPSANDAALSTVFFNLGYEIDWRDMRRGDLVAIDWTSGHGHATFCWDVHFDESGAVDCFSFLSANGLKRRDGTYAGAGVSISTSHVELFISHDKVKKTYKKLKNIFADDDPNTRKYASWYCVPGVMASDVKLETFKDPTPIKSNIVDKNAKYGAGIADCRVVRFWGFPPPDSPHGSVLTSDKAATARQLAKWPMPPSQASGSGTPPKGVVVKQAPVAQVPKSHPDPVKAAPPPPAPAKQPATEVVVHQHFVEDALSQLYAAGWIDKSPGKGDSVADPQTKAAVEDFQKKHKCPPIDGIPGPITRAGLKRVLADLHAGKPNPDKPDRKPVIDHFCWLCNRVDPGQANVLAVHGQNLDLVQSFEISLTDQQSKKSVTLPFPMVAVDGVGLQPVAIPAVFGIGSVITARLHGGGLDKSSDVPLYVGQAVPVPQSDWPWDETKWPAQMQNVIAELRRTPKGAGSFHRREITQYGVKEKIASGDVQVLDKKGRVLGTTDKRSLFLADIEGTMRINGRILNIAQSGNVYDQTATRIIGGVAVKKPKPSLERFDPSKSRWVDVTDRAPWGFGAKMPLIPYRVLAHNPKTETPLYGRIVYIKQLDGLALPTGETHNGMCIVGDCGGMAPAGAQFDFFVGREDHHISIPTLAASQGGSVCDVEILGMCSAAHR